MHRLALSLPEARYATAVAANTGWYTMPTLGGRKLPYGLRDFPSTPETLGKALGNRLVLLLGEQDTDAEDPFLRQSKGARRQGKNRFERGQALYAAAGDEAARLGVTLNWALETVPGAAHFDQRMMPAAARAFQRITNRSIEGESALTASTTSIGDALPPPTGDVYKRDWRAEPRTGKHFRIRPKDRTRWGGLFLGLRRRLR